ncbi:MAG: hypothetical protein ACTHJN_03390 [Ginsengibacter sp.]
MKFNQTDINNLLRIVQNGRQNALTASQIETMLNQKFGFPISGNQNLARSLIKFAISSGHLIKSSTANPAGFWLTTNKNEIVKNIDSLKRRAQKTSDSADSLKMTWNANNPNDLII